MEVSDKDMGEERALTKLMSETVPEYTKAGSTIEDVDAIPDPHLETRSVAAIPHVFRLRCGSRSSHAPEF
jgi:hypothetical protein